MPWNTQGLCTVGHINLKPVGFSTSVVNQELVISQSSACKCIPWALSCFWTAEEWVIAWGFLRQNSDEGKMDERFRESRKMLFWTQWSKSWSVLRVSWAHSDFRSVGRLNKTPSSLWIWGLLNNCYLEVWFYRNYPFPHYLFCWLASPDCFCSGQISDKSGKRQTCQI